MINKLFLCFLLMLSLPLLAKSPDINDMTDAEREATGVNKLTEEELSALDDWIKNKQHEIDRKIRQRNAGFEARRDSTERREIKARLEKTYDDKLGDTYYELDNGQIWKRISGGSVFIKSGGRNLVTIEPKMMGSWSLRVDGNRSVKVKRIK